MELVATTSSMMEQNFSRHCCLAPFGIHFNIGTEAIAKDECGLAVARLAAVKMDDHVLVVVMLEKGHPVVKAGSD